MTASAEFLGVWFVGSGVGSRPASNLGAVGPAENEAEDEGADEQKMVQHLQQFQKDADCCMYLIKMVINTLCINTKCIKMVWVNWRRFCRFAGMTGLLGCTNTGCITSVFQCQPTRESRPGVVVVEIIKLYLVQTGRS